MTPIVEMEMSKEPKTLVLIAQTYNIIEYQQPSRKILVSSLKISNKATDIWAPVSTKHLVLLPPIDAKMYSLALKKQHLHIS